MVAAVVDRSFPTHLIGSRLWSLALRPGESARAIQCYSFVSELGTMYPRQDDREVACVAWLWCVGRGGGDGGAWGEHRLPLLVLRSLLS